MNRLVTLVTEKVSVAEVSREPIEVASEGIHVHDKWQRENPGQGVGHGNRSQQNVRRVPNKEKSSVETSDAFWPAVLA